MSAAAKVTNQDVLSWLRERCFETHAMAAAAVTAETRFVEDVGMDSLDVAELIMALEEAFDVTIADADAEKLRTVGEAVRYVDEKRRCPSDEANPERGCTIPGGTP